MQNRPLLLSSTLAMVKDHAARHTHVCIVYIAYTHTATCFAKLYTYPSSKWHTSSNEGQPTDTSRSHPATLRLNCTHGSALAPFGTCNKLKQLPRHLWDRLHKRTVYTAVIHGLVFCAPASDACAMLWRFIGGNERSKEHVFANENDISCRVAIEYPQYLEERQSLYLLNLQHENNIASVHVNLRTCIFFATILSCKWYRLYLL